MAFRSELSDLARAREDAPVGRPDPAPRQTGRLSWESSGDGYVTSVVRRDTYRIVVRSGALDELGELLREVAERLDARSLLVVTDSVVEALHLVPALCALEALGLPLSVISIPAGERSKSVERLLVLWQELLHGRDRAPDARRVARRRRRLRPRRLRRRDVHARVAVRQRPDVGARAGRRRDRRQGGGRRPACEEPAGRVSPPVDGGGRSRAADDAAGGGDRQRPRRGRQGRRHRLSRR